MRIVAFVGSPVASEEKELVKLAKKLKKEKVNVDVISFGEDAVNSEVLTVFVNTLNGKVRAKFSIIDFIYFTKTFVFYKGWCQ